ncbi:hypothetical protein NQ317_016991 [Molorchus minor]|uniref:Uncharacterized protein n=1 Tax=Molorchus minor TaxID=1323400 RepID=A0ABQ9JKB4_9CUCU|nr:hypothetical protein NQ317_016991 [Molorchus minor]
MTIVFDGIDYEYPRNDPSPPDLSQTLPKSKTAVFGPRKRLQLFLKLSEHSRLFPNIPDFARTLPKARNSGIDYEYPPKRSEPSPIFPELSRSLKPPCEESIATIPETIRALPIFPELSRSLKPPSLASFLTFFKVQGIDLDYSRGDTNTPELSRFFTSSPEI